MGRFTDMVHNDQSLGGVEYLMLGFSAAGLVTNQNGVDVGTTPTSGIYRMKAEDLVVHAISAMGDAAAIIYLPPVGIAAGNHYFIIAPTGAAGGDISLYTIEGNTEYTGGGDDGDMDADGDHVIVYSSGIAWYTRLDGVA